MLTKRNKIRFQIRKRGFVRTIKKKIQEKFEHFRLRFLGGVAFWIFAPIGSHVNENEKY